jgi:uncharacterized protein (TIRG00374 family)
MSSLAEATATRHARSGRARTLAVRTAVGLAVGALLVAAFLRLVDVSAVYQRLTHLSIGYALLFGVAFLGAFVVRAMRWRCLLRPCEISIGRAVAIYQVATFINWLLPVRGGELVKGLLLRRSDGIPISRSLATVSLDKAMDLLPAVALLALLPFVGLHLGRSLWVLLLSALAVVGAGVLLLGFLAWRRERALALLRRPIAALLPARARERVEPSIVVFVDTLLALVRQPRLMLTAVAYTVLAVSFDALSCVLAFKAVGVAVAVPVVLYGYTLYNLAFILPTPPGQVGSNELIGLLIFSGVFSVDRTGVGAMFLFSHPWSSLLMTASGLLCLSVMGLSLRSTLRLATDQEEVEPA